MMQILPQRLKDYKVKRTNYVWWRGCLDKYISDLKLAFRPLLMLNMLKLLERRKYILTICSFPDIKTF